MLSVEECNLNYVIPANYVDVNASNRINDVVSNNNIMCCNRHIPAQGKCALASTIKSQHDLTYIRNDILNMLKYDAFWSNYKVVTSPGDGHCLIHSAVNSINGITSASNVDVSVLLKYLSDETVHNADRYIYFIDGNGRESLIHGLNEYEYVNYWIFRQLCIRPYSYKMSIKRIVYNYHLSRECV